MLSSNSIKLLGEACERSGLMYDQGGLNYLYKFGYQKSHAFFGYDLLKGIEGERVLDEHEIKQLVLFFASALEDHNAEKYGELTINTTNNLLSSLLKDFKGMHGFISGYEESDTWKEITISFIEEYDFHSLELFWAID